ncbi:MAG: bacteriophage abortive infection AbiH family protein, partial [Crocinitomicaceae bacterium]|nr:bacteriophage abortive infection AbiH family protein [Crocinitomicaceae bacterium]
MDNEYNRIVIVGNGYDLALNIPTSYNDFLMWHLKEAAISSMNRPYNDDPLFKIKHTPYNNKDQIKSNFESCKEIGSFLNYFKRNFKFEYTSAFFEQLIDQVLDTNWVDIENIYFNFLIRNLKSIQKSEPLNRNYEAIEELNTQLDFLKNQLEKYLIDVQTKYKISCLESPMGSLHDELNEKLIGDQAYIMHKLHHTEIGNPNKIVFLNFNYTNYLKQLTFSRWPGNIIIN